MQCSLDLAEFDKECGFHSSQAFTAHVLCSFIFSLRVLIIRSTTPGSFCAGADLNERRIMTKEQVSKFLQDLRTAFRKYSQFAVPRSAYHNSNAWPLLWLMQMPGCRHHKCRRPRPSTGRWRRRAKGKLFLRGRSLLRCHHPLKVRSIRPGQCRTQMLQLH